MDQAVAVKRVIAADWFMNLVFSRSNVNPVNVRRNLANDFGDYGRGVTIYPVPAAT